MSTVDTNRLITFYEYENRVGPGYTVEVTAENENVCYNLPEEWKDRISRIEVFQGCTVKSCLKFFTETNCRGNLACEPPNCYDSNRSKFRKSAKSYRVDSKC